MRTIALLVALTGLAARAGAVDGVRIAECAFARTVAADKSFVDPFDDVHQPAAGSPVYFWMRIEASPAALDRLARERRLPLRHRWFTALLTTIAESPADEEAQGSPLLVDSIPLDGAAPELLAPLRREVARRGYFDWRTWSVKRRARRGPWQVTVVDNRGDEIPCTVPCGCRFAIAVQ